MCVVYFYNKLKVICATSKHLERDKCWQVGSRYGNLNRPVGFPIHRWNQLRHAQNFKKHQSEKLIESGKKKLKICLESGNQKFGEARIERGIFYDDSLLATDVCTAINSFEENEITLYNEKSKKNDIKLHESNQNGIKNYSTHYVNTQQ